MSYLGAICPRVVLSTSWDREYIFLTGDYLPLHCNDIVKNILAKIEISLIKIMNVATYQWGKLLHFLNLQFIICERGIILSKKIKNKVIPTISI